MVQRKKKVELIIVEQSVQKVSNIFIRLKKTCLGVLDREERDKDNEIGLKEGGGIEMSTSVLHSRYARSLRFFHLPCRSFYDTIFICVPATRNGIFSIVHNERYFVTCIWPRHTIFNFSGLHISKRILRIYIVISVFTYVGRFSSCQFLYGLFYSIFYYIFDIFNRSLVDVVGKV